MRWLQLHLLLLVIAAVSANPAGPTVTSAGCKTYPCLIFEDEFNFLDMDKWEHEITCSGAGNEEFQFYHNNRKNSFTRDGKLYIKPTLVEEEMSEDWVRHGTLDLWGSSPTDLCSGNAWGGCYRVATPDRVLPPLRSARLRTIRTFNVAFGKVEFEAKMPTGDWIWPAVWMLSKHDEYGAWPASGEIDLVEARGNRQLYDANNRSVGVDQMGMTLHWGPKFPYNGWPKTHVTKNLEGGKTFGTGFHKYTMEWGPDIGIVWYLDGVHLKTINPPEGFWKLGQFKDSSNKPLDDKLNPWKPELGATKLAPFDKAFYLIMNVAVGGTTFFADNFDNKPYPKPWKNYDRSAVTKFYNTKHLWYPTWNDTNDGTAMQVKYMRVWKMKADP